MDVDIYKNVQTRVKLNDPRCLATREYKFENNKLPGGRIDGRVATEGMGAMMDGMQKLPRVRNDHL